MKLQKTNDKILIIDDDTRLRNLIAQFLEKNGFLVSVAKNTAEAKNFMKETNFNLLIVDVMLPQQNGIDFVFELRKTSNVAVIILTAKGDSDDRIKGLEAGADDYLPKPFEPKELLLRINNIIKRNSGLINFPKIKESEVFYFGNFIFNPQNSRLKKGEEFIHLTESEAKILYFLCKEKGNIISREKISAFCGEIDERSVDVQINRIRKKIEENPKQPKFLQTSRNHGYVLFE
jgi:two-component system phosphate regulon response regulator OmpR